MAKQEVHYSFIKTQIPLAKINFTTLQPQDVNRPWDWLLQPQKRFLHCSPDTVAVNWDAQLRIGHVHGACVSNNSSIHSCKDLSG